MKAEMLCHVLPLPGSGEPCCCIWVAALSELLSAPGGRLFQRWSMKGNPWSVRPAGPERRTCVPAPSVSPAACTSPAPSRGTVSLAPIAERAWYVRLWLRTGTSQAPGLLHGLFSSWGSSGESARKGDGKGKPRDAGLAVSEPGLCRLGDSIPSTFVITHIFSLSLQMTLGGFFCAWKVRLSKVK